MNIQAQSTEKRPGSVAKQESRTAQNNYQEEADDMNESTRTHSLGHQGGVQMSPTGERGVLHLGMVQSTGDAVIYSLTTDQARDLADSIFVGADQIDALDEAADADEAKMIADGAPLLRDLKWFLKYSDGWRYDNWPAAVEALTGDGYDSERLLYITDVYRAAQVLEVSTVELMQDFVNAAGAMEASR